jgi:hypothetical protein
MLFAATIEDTPGMAAARRGVRAAPAGRGDGRMTGPHPRRAGAAPAA